VAIAPNFPGPFCGGKEEKWQWDQAAQSREKGCVPFPDSYLMAVWEDACYIASNRDFVKAGCLRYRTVRSLARLRALD